ncbi:MAG: putative glycosyltransferase EpsD [candidate division BRC1 bacterium ADurb.BinA364]|nr:MAG: putative glycosyltransferase EpsD [candidate division BRC1 bacterium ADurb.BinA364]
MSSEWDFFAPGRLALLAGANGADLLHAHASLAHGLAWRTLRRAPRALLVVTRRVDFAVGGNWLSRAKYRNPRTRYIAISSGVRQALEQGGVAPDRIATVPSGIDAGRFSGQYGRQDLLDEFHLPPETFIVGNIAALTDHKGQCYLIDAAKFVLDAHPNAFFLIAGEGELRVALESQIRRLGLGGRVVLTGFRRDIEKILAGIDLFAVSSHLEGLCTSLLDAMHFGKPAVGTRVGGVVDAIEPERSGLLVPARDPRALANAICRMIEQPETRARFGAAARRIAGERFTAESMVEGTAKAYDRFLAERR